MMFLHASPIVVDSIHTPHKSPTDLRTPELPEDSTIHDKKKNAKPKNWLDYKELSPKWARPRVNAKAKVRKTRGSSQSSSQGAPQANAPHRRIVMWPGAVPDPSGPQIQWGRRASESANISRLRLSTMILILWYSLSLIRFIYQFQQLICFSVSSFQKLQHTCSRHRLMSVRLRSRSKMPRPLEAS
jgi:hypothetical protein